ncbi:hypothetical protein [Rhizobium etli]|uniref:hypothetical protein n=1 Tax=Rhizobium etli TaxID=29449 RepID=UPI00140F61B9|nr:hypothetical protein [Rhizobium etli]
MLQQQGAACEDDENEDGERNGADPFQGLRPGFLAASSLAVKIVIPHMLRE